MKIQIFLNIFALQVISIAILALPLQAQVSPPLTPPSREELPEPEIPKEEPKLELEKPAPESIETEPQKGISGQTFEVKQIKIIGSTIFSSEDFEKILRPFQKEKLSLAEILAASAAVTDLYKEKGYISSFAYVQEIKEGIVKIKVIEGVLGDIEVEVKGRLTPEYVRSRIRVKVGEEPLNEQRLKDALILLLIDPAIKNLSANLRVGERMGKTSLLVKVTSTKPASMYLRVDNRRSPAIGSVNRQVIFPFYNIANDGDLLVLGYTNTDGSNSIDARYNVPVNARNGQIRLAFGQSDATVIQEPFERLDIESNFKFFELTFSQPIVQNPNQEFNVGLTFSRQESQNSLLGKDFPLSAGDNEDGKTKLSVIRFFQEWTKRGQQDVFTARSQFNWGTDLFGTTTDAPINSIFFTWLGQGQYVRLLDKNTFLVLRGNLQFSNDGVPALERIVLGGAETVRGYRQAYLLTDNGVFLSAEVRLPIYSWEEQNMLLQIIPFVDYGRGWNTVDNESENIAGIGLGIRYQLDERLEMRIDYAVRLTEANNLGNTAQEKGLYFRIIGKPF